jgi:porin
LSLWLATTAAVLGFVSQAHAQTDPAQPPSQLPAPTGGGVPSRQAAAPQADASESDKFKQLNKLVLKGWVTAVPTFDDTVDQDAGGWRSALAKAGFGLTFYSINLVGYDMAQAGRGLSGPQLYNGQKLTYQAGNHTAVLTYDLGRVSDALAGGQLQAIITGTTNGYQARDGIRGVRVKGLSWYQPILHGKVELELGIIANQTDYMGTSVGGSLSGGALGPQAGIPVEAGMSYGQYGAPTFSARINWTSHLYTRTGLQRSISPRVRQPSRIAILMASPSPRRAQGPLSFRNWAIASCRRQALNPSGCVRAGFTTVRTTRLLSTRPSTPITSPMAPSTGS